MSIDHSILNVSRIIILNDSFLTKPIICHNYDSWLIAPKSTNIVSNRSANVSNWRSIDGNKLLLDEHECSFFYIFVRIDSKRVSGEQLCNTVAVELHSFSIYTLYAGARQERSWIQRMNIARRHVLGAFYPVPRNLILWPYHGFVIFNSQVHEKSVFF